MSATERLSMLDPHGGRERIIPAEVKGPLRRWRVVVHAVLMLVLLALPWIRINGMQAVLLDLPGRRFQIFGVLFLAHDAPYVFFILILSALLLIFVTAIWGRVWCGWACPQTVFIDAVYRRIEIWIEGNYLQRRKLAAAPMSVEKAFKLFLKWSSYLVVSSLITHSVMAYFTGAPQLIAMMQSRPGENWVYFLFATSITGVLLFNFGWFREQFCIIMCPYGRLQGALMDQRTVTVLYDQKRGEPRKGSVRGQKLGDCVSCNRCVEVCPVKIDIRDGIQMECIACTACIDACNEIMRRVKKPEGLIRHASQSTAESLFFRPRVILYAVLILFFSGLLGVAMIQRKPHSLMIIRAKDAPFQILNSGQVLNHFKTHYMNQSTEVRKVEFVLPETEVARGLSLTQAVQVHEVRPGEAISPHIFVAAPKSAFNERGEVTFTLRLIDHLSGTSEEIEAKALGPYSSGS
ncbi:MAG: cytochrome c oxidase accessory protein CcoG [Bdellovibrionales bacterium]|nr:cytochrome c oxidase accessory protein CcoG [Bdellovibrionales bacterium]